MTFSGCNGNHTILTGVSMASKFSIILDNDDEIPFVIAFSHPQESGFGSAITFSVPEQKCQATFDNNSKAAWDRLHDGRVKVNKGVSFMEQKLLFVLESEPGQEAVVTLVAHGDVPADGRIFSSMSFAEFEEKGYYAYRARDNYIYWSVMEDDQKLASVIRDWKTYSTPVLAQFDGKLYMVHRGTDDALYWSVLEKEQGAWSQAEKIKEAETYSAPALAEFDGKLYMAHSGLGDEIWWAPLDRKNSDADRIEGWKTYRAPALARFGNKLYLVHRGIDNRIYYATYERNWSTVNSIDGGYTDEAPVLAAINGKLHILYMDNLDRPQAIPLN